MPNRRRPRIAPRPEPEIEIRWWEVLFGGIAVALAVFALIWVFAVFGYALQGAA